MLDALDIAASIARQAVRYPSSTVVNASPTSGKIAKKQLSIILLPKRRAKELEYRMGTSSLIARCFMPPRQAQSFARHIRKTTPLIDSSVALPDRSAKFYSVFGTSTGKFWQKTPG